MCDQKYQGLLRGLLEFNLKVLNPRKTGTEQSKTSRLFRVFHFSHIGLALLLLTFAYFERNHLTFFTIMENLASAMVVLRSVAYVLLVQWFYDAYKVQLQKIFEDRTSLPSNENERLLTEFLCRREYRILLALNVFVGGTGMFLIHMIAYFFPNDYHLTFNCYWFFLPPDEFSFNWELNLLFMIVTAFFDSLFYVCFFPLPVMMVNHTCWLLDMALMTAQQMNTDLQPEVDFTDQERIVTTNGHLGEIIARCEKIVEWRNDVQELLAWNFDLEFHIQVVVLCIAIYVLSLDLFASYIVQNAFLVCLIQLFFYCWMGARVTSRYDQLSFEISKNWYLMNPKQRKSLQMVLHWTQNMNGFTGTFKDVSMETFQSILEASYSFYTFLRSTRG